jgi:hypothetical protein
VPEVQTIAVGHPVAFALPKAKKAAERSSKMEIASISGADWAKATAKGVDREPGQITAVVNPRCFNVCVNIEAQSSLVFLKPIGMKFDLAKRQS